MKALALVMLLAVCVGGCNRGESPTGKAAELLGSLELSGFGVSERPGTFPGLKTVPTRDFTFDETITAADVLCSPGLTSRLDRRIKIEDPQSCGRYVYFLIDPIPTEECRGFFHVNRLHPETIKVGVICSR
jgi:hypothetical protein